MLKTPCSRFLRSKRQFFFVDLKTECFAATKSLRRKYRSEKKNPESKHTIITDERS